MSVAFVVEGTTCFCKRFQTIWIHRGNVLFSCTPFHLSLIMNTTMFSSYLLGSICLTCIIGGKVKVGMPVTEKILTSLQNIFDVTLR